LQVIKFKACFRGKISLFDQEFLNLQSPTCTAFDLSFWDVKDGKDYTIPSNLLGTSNPVVSSEDMNLLPTVQSPASLDMEVLNMFPVAELSDLNNADLSFLDSICIPDNQHSGIDNMTDLITVEGSSLTELNGLPVDWLSEDGCLDNPSEESSSLPSTNLDKVLFSSISKSSNDNCSGVTTESSSSTYQIHSLIDNSLFTEVPWSEEGLYSSSEESRVQVTDAHCDMSPISENSDITSHNVDDYHAAGKKYLQMRQKNNIASQRSRKLRKQKNCDMVERLKELETENQQLTKLAAELEKQRDALQRKLLQTVARK